MSIQNNFLKWLIPILICVFGVTFLFFLSLRTHIRWSESSYTGQVVSVSDDSFTLQDGGSIKREIFVTKETVIKRGRETVVTGLWIGDMIVVAGFVDTNGRIQAKLVRVLEKDRNH